MILSYKNFLKVLLFILFFGTNIFPQYMPPAKSGFIWENPLPSGDDYTTSINLPNGILIGGDGGSLIYADKKLKKKYEAYLHEEVIAAGTVPDSDAAFVVLFEKYSGKSHTFYTKEPKSDFDDFMNERATIDERVTGIVVNDRDIDLDQGFTVTETSTGNIYTSVDSGKNFTNTPIDADEILNDVLFTETGRGIAVGEHDGTDSTKNNIYLKDPETDPNDPESSDKWHPLSKNHSDNASRRVALFAKKWKSVATVNKNIAPYIHITLQNDPIFILGYDPAANLDIVARSTDNGSSWDSVFAVQTAYMTALSVSNSTNAIIGGYGGTIYYTKDGGDTWNKGNNNNQEFIHSITHISADSAYAFGNYGIILLTTDGGENWTQISGDISTSLYGVYFTSPSIGYAAGLSGFSTLKVYKTTDAGENWNVVYVDSSFSPSNAFFNSIFFIDDMTGFIAGSKFIRTIDGGMTWNELNAGVSSSNPIFLDVYFVNNNLGFAVYRDPATGDGAIKTTDGGDMWDPININNDKHDKQYVYFADENLGFISGNSTLYRTTDGGDSWDTLAVGHNNQNLNSKVTFINSTTGFFGKKGQVFKTTDKGDTWTDAPIDINSVPKQIQFVGDSIGYLICVSDTFGVPIHLLYKTTDGGSSWVDLTDELPGSTSFGAMFFTDDSTGYLVGPRGKIIKTTTGGGEVIVTSVRQEDNVSIPSDFKLYQNYPNPFNPSTTIKFAIPKESYTKLEIFNILGEKVMTLVSEMLSPGAYKYKWDAGRYSSGVYFYRITAGNFIQTKKLLLLK